MCNHTGNKGSGFHRTEAALPLYLSCEMRAVLDCRHEAFVLSWIDLQALRAIRDAFHNRTSTIAADSGTPSGARTRRQVLEEEYHEESAGDYYVKLCRTCSWC